MYPLLVFSILTLGLIAYNSIRINEKSLLGLDVLKMKYSRLWII